MFAQNRLLFRAAIFLASFLLFVSEPMAAKQLLPTFGGSAAVWITCLVFFQVALLAGYLYAHAITRGPATQRQSRLHIVLLVAAVVCAVGWSTGYPHLHLDATQPVSGIFAALAVSIGLPFLVLASTSPLLQVWLAREEQNTVSYRLFALSNTASLLALLLYPTFIEPHLSLSLQRDLWAGGVALFALITAVIAWQSRTSLQRTTDNEQRQVSPLRARLLWFLLPMAAAMQLAAVTAHLTSNIAAIPLLWVLPLAVYLITFILAFQFPQLFGLRAILMGLLAVMLVSLGLLLSNPDLRLPIYVAIVLFLIEVFLACLFCHVEAYALRPEGASETTLFYLIVAAGGATGSFLVGIAAPLIFYGNYDTAIAFLITALLAVAAMRNVATTAKKGFDWAGILSGNPAWTWRLLWTGCSALLLSFVVTLHTAYLRQTILSTRNFYATLRVKQSVTEHGDPIRTLLNGTIQHGNQIFSPDLSHVPTTYFAENSGVGVALNNCCAGRPRRIGIVGLGVGTIAAYGKAGDSIRFYEINPGVQPIASNLFTYLRDSPAQIALIEGDARASLAAESPQKFDILIVDAFSGDAIPLHLLTVEALTLYRRHLVPGGVLAFHVSNQYVNLEPEIALLATSAGMQSHRIESAEDKQSGEFAAVWVLASGKAAFFGQAAVATRISPIKPASGLRPWTDEYSSLLPILHW